MVNAPAPFSGSQELPDDVKCCCWVAPVCMPWLKLTSVSSDNHSHQGWVSGSGTWILRTGQAICVTAGTHCFDSGVLLEFQIGREKFLFFLFCWITKKPVTSWALDIQRQRFKAGLAGFCYSDDVLQGGLRERQQSLSDQNNNNWKGKPISFLKPSRNNSGNL